VCMRVHVCVALAQLLTPRYTNHLSSVIV